MGTQPKQPDADLNDPELFSFRRYSPWYEDGDVVIEVYSSDKTIEPAQFRLHQAVLALHSNFFRTMFRTGPNGSTWVEGQQNVILRDEDIDDFALLMKEIYCEDDFHFLHFGSIDRLVMKCDRYQCDRLLKPFAKFCRLLSNSFELLNVAFSLKIDIDYCCSLASWALKHWTELRQQPFLLNGKQLWKQLIFQLCTLMDNLQCIRCESTFCSLIKDPAWDGSLSFVQKRRFCTANHDIDATISIYLKSMLPISQYLK